MEVKKESKKQGFTKSKLDLSNKYNVLKFKNKVVSRWLRSHVQRVWWISFKTSYTEHYDITSQNLSLWGFRRTSGSDFYIRSELLTGKTILEPAGSLGNDFQSMKSEW